MILWLLILIALVAFAFIILNKWNNKGGVASQGEGSALDILKKRYAKGEITKEEFDKMKKDLE